MLNQLRTGKRRKGTAASRVLPCRPRLSRALLALLAASLVSACGGGGGGDGGPPAARTGDLQVSIPVETRAQTLADGALVVSTRVDGGAPQSMTLTGELAEIELADIATGSHSVEVSITFEHTEFGAVALANVSRTVTIEAGDNRLEVLASDFDLDALDDDADGQPNIDELAGGLDPADACDGAKGRFWGNLRWGQGSWAASAGDATDQCT